jgi:hypothetical protein
MKTSPATVENTFQRCMGIKFCGGITKPFSQIIILIIAKTRLLAKDSCLLASTSRLQAKVSRLLANISRLQAKVSRFRVNTSRLLANTSRLRVNTSRLQAKVSRLQANIDRLLASITRLLASITRLLAKVSCLRVGDAFLHKIDSKYTIEYIVLNFDAWVINNIRGNHYNNEFVNYHRLKIKIYLFIITFDRSHKYWCESDYFS